MRGAVIYGTEKTRTRKFKTMRTCPNSYGINLAEPYSEIDHRKADRAVNLLTNASMAVRQVRWLIRKGDVIISNSPRTVHESFKILFKEAGKITGEIPICTYRHDDIPNPLIGYNIAPDGLYFDKAKESHTYTN
jgi:hypothetical protein